MLTNRSAGVRFGLLACMAAGLLVSACNDAKNPTERTARRGAVSAADGDGITIVEDHVPAAQKMAVPDPSLSLAGEVPGNWGTGPRAERTSVGGATYTVSVIPFTPEPAPTASLGPDCDDCVAFNIPIGFTFAFYGNSYTHLNLSSNGFVQFGGGAVTQGCCSGENIPLNDSNNNIIALAWTDWFPPSNPGGFRYETRGTAPNRRFIVQWTNIPEYFNGPGSLTGQIVLSEGSDDITLYTTSLSLGGHIATQGIENATGTEAAFVSGRVRTRLNLTNDAVLFSTHEHALVPPVANAGAPQGGVEGTPVGFDASATTDADNDIVSYQWNFGDGVVVSSPLATISHAYADNRDVPYNVLLTVTDAVGNTSTATTTALITNAPPTAVAGYHDATGTGDPRHAIIPSGGSLDFAGSFDDAGIDDHDWTYTIDWGDNSPATTGTKSSLADKSILASHTFPAGQPNGTPYDVRLTVVDKDGGEGSDAIAVSLTNSAPTVAVVGGPVSGDEGSEIAIAASATDPEGDAVTYSWHFDGPATASSVDSPNAHVTFADNGTFMATVIATDAVGNSASATAPIVVANVSPTAVGHVSVPTVNEGSGFHISLSEIADPSPVDLASLEFAFDCGNGFGAYGSNPDATCTPDDNGSVAVAAKVRDKDGGENSYALGSVAVLNVDPTASFGNNGPVNEGGSFTLNLSGARDASSRDAAAGFSYAFDCGAGYGMASTSASATCDAPDNADRAVRGRIADKDGGSTEYLASVHINNVAPSVNAGSGASIRSGESFNLAGHFADPGLADALWSYRIDWSNGTPTSGQTSDQSAIIASSHRYLRIGSYTVGLSVTDKDGGVGAGATTVQVERLPVAMDIFPYASTLQNTVYYNTASPLKSTPVVVALLGSATFQPADAATRAVRLDLPSLRLGRTSLVKLPTTPFPLPNGGYAVAVLDVNRDGILDVLLTFRLDQLVANGDLSSAVATAQNIALTGDHADGRQFTASDNVRVIPVTVVSDADERPR